MPDAPGTSRERAGVAPAGADVPGRESRRTLPTKKDLAYGAGAMLDGWGLMGVKNTAHQVLNIVLGVNPAPSAR